MRFFEGLRVGRYEKKKETKRIFFNFFLQKMLEKGGWEGGLMKRGKEEKTSHFAFSFVLWVSNFKKNNRNGTTRSPIFKNSRGESRFLL